MADPGDRREKEVGMVLSPKRISDKLRTEMLKAATARTCDLPGDHRGRPELVLK